MSIQLCHHFCCWLIPIGLTGMDRIIEIRLEIHWYTWKISKSSSDSFNVKLQTIRTVLVCFSTSWLLSLLPETSRWSEGRNGRGSGLRRRSSRSHARRRRVRREHYTWTADGQLTHCVPGLIVYALFVFVCLSFYFLKSPRNAPPPTTRRTTGL